MGLERWLCLRPRVEGSGLILSTHIWYSLTLVPLLEQGQSHTLKGNAPPENTKGYLYSTQLTMGVRFGYSWLLETTL